jgi:hypothetical protein
MELEALNTNGVRVAAYLIGSGLCAAALLLERQRPSRNRLLLVVWVILALLMAVLGLARVVDLGPWLTDVGRHRAELEGWYDERRDIQLNTLRAVLVGTGIVAVGMLWVVPGHSRSALPPAVSAVCLLGFVLVRAISFHDVDRVLQQDAYHGLLLNTACELGLLVLFGGSVGWAIVAGRDNGGRPVAYASG